MNRLNVPPCLGAWTQTLGAVLVMWVTAFTPAATADKIGQAASVRDAVQWVDMWLDRQVAVQQLPSLSIGVIHDQELVWSKAYGFANIERRIPATTDTIYSVCSISKVFTGIAIMQLRDRGMLHLGQDVSALLPWFDVEQSYPDSGAITIGGLLTHSSGLPKELEQPYWLEQSFPTREEFKRMLSGTETLYPAATFEEYSNVGFELAGWVVEELSGMPFMDYVRAEILEPLEMTNTTLDIPIEKRDGSLATAYSGRGRNAHRDVIPPYQIKGLTAAAGMASTVNDLAKFISWQFRLLRAGGTELLRSSTLREMQKVHWYNSGSPFHRGYGYSVADLNGTTYVGKDGGCPGYLSLFMLNPDSKTGGVIMVNANGTDVWDLLKGALELLEPAIAMARTSPGAQPLADNDLSRFTGVYQSYPSDMEIGVIAQDNHLAYISLHSESPGSSIVKLRPLGGELFEKLRKDGGPAGQIHFRTDVDGRVTHFVQPGSAWRKIR